MSPSLATVAGAAVALSAALAGAQGVGSTREVHPRLKTWKCTTAGGCKPLNSAIVIDSLAHPMNRNCGDWGKAANPTACPDLATCQRNCVTDGISDYTRHGIFTNGAALTLKQLQPDGRSVVSPRVYLLAESEQQYEMIKLTGQEFTFDVDVSKLPCGMNGALYMSEMKADGGKKKEPLNKGGAFMGTGYCDAQCFTTPFINGVGNLDGSGSCCNELDIWEANSAAESIAPHTCNKPGLFKCKGAECELDGNCDKWGCTYKPYTFGNKNHYGRGKNFRVDTTRPFTVVTQFPTDSRGVLQAIKRIYVQDGVQIPQAPVNLPQFPNLNSLTQALCDSKPGEARRFNELGGLKGMGESMARGMVLAMSVWWSDGDFMNWLDSPPCSETEGKPSEIVKVQPNPAVVFSNIKWGDINSTFTGRPPKCKRDVGLGL
ncbi:hypothetical protein RB597_005574 [Gaeumannomyces tritici]